MKSWKNNKIGKLIIRKRRKGSGGGKKRSKSKGDVEEIRITRRGLRGRLRAR